LRSYYTSREKLLHSYYTSREKFLHSYYTSREKFLHSYYTSREKFFIGKTHTCTCNNGGHEHPISWSVEIPWKI
jgi:hypothetical protein